MVMMGFGVGLSTEEQKSLDEFVKKTNDGNEKYVCTASATFVDEPELVLVRMEPLHKDADAPISPFYGVWLTNSIPDDEGFYRFKRFIGVDDATS